MSRKFEINGKEYDSIPFTFNTVCELEEKGISLDDFDTRNLSILRAYFALAVGDVVTAGNEIEAHIIGGGDLSSLMEAIGYEMENSGFFNAIAEKKEKSPQDHQKPKSTATKPKK